MNTEGIAIVFLEIAAIILEDWHFIIAGMETILLSLESSFWMNHLPLQFQ